MKEWIKSFWKIEIAILMKVETYIPFFIFKFEQF